ncbi:MAG TPA: type II toxin-antitoxin system RelE/ParE family toxin [Rhizobium sp.]|uniref:type II toxin-antitoxin system RelE/ParE family toxin n=1 Tax=Rhizobium sp. F40D2 TaxID=3453141 RepID=UPI002CA531D1|nr:type II toxin-antitoxin system RelE/ParE family toxin [Rhizobium sp.]
MAAVVYSRRARADMLDLWLWIAEKSGQPIADTVIDRIERRIASLERHPQMGPKRPDIARGARILVVERWLVLYACDSDDVRIVRVIDGASDLRDIGWEEWPAFTHAAAKDLRMPVTFPSNSWYGR